LRALLKLHAALLQVWDLIVVGAGVAGAALAYRQGKVRQAARADNDVLWRG
jgi:choline dehydrogenase-like flavoprotein